MKDITAKQFEKMTGISFDDFDAALGYELKKKSSDKEKPENFEKVSKTKIYKEIVEAAKKLNLASGDLGRISSWRQKDDRPILSDAGLTKKIYSDFYSSIARKP